MPGHTSITVELWTKSPKMCPKIPKKFSKKFLLEDIGENVSFGQ